MAIITVKSAARHFAESLGLAGPSAHLPAAGIDEDPFHDPLLMAIGIVFVVMLIAILALTGLIYWGVEYQSPPWSSHAYPPPLVH
jgi:hypothetical protein